MSEAFVNLTEGSGKKPHFWDRSIGANTVLDQFFLPGEFPYATYTIATTTSVALATGNDHLLQIMAGSSLNVRLRRLRIWQAVATTSTTNFQMQLLRLTTAGTGGTAYTPGKVNNADAAAGATAMTRPSAKGTEGTILDIYNPLVSSAFATGNNLLLVDYQPRADEEPYIIPAGTANGLAVKNISTQAAGSFFFVADIVETAFV